MFFLLFIGRGPSSVSSLAPLGGPHPGPAPHVNPAFFSQHGGPPSSSGDPYSRLPPGQYGDYMGPIGPDSSMVQSISDAEFDEIMSKNRSVSASAINRAVSDAATGNYWIANYEKIY